MAQHPGQDGPELVGAWLYAATSIFSSVVFNLDDVVCKRPEVASQEISGGAVLVDMVSGKCWELNPVGAMFWSSIEPGAAALREICRAIRERCEGMAEGVVENDVLKLVEDLSVAGLVQLRAPSPGSHG